MVPGWHSGRTGTAGRIGLVLDRNLAIGTWVTSIIFIGLYRTRVSSAAPITGVSSFFGTPAAAHPYVRILYTLGCHRSFNVR